MTRLHKIYKEDVYANSHSFCTTKNYGAFGRTKHASCQCNSSIFRLYQKCIQSSLNRIAQNYPAIPKLATVDGIYGSRTEASVRVFQEIFGLEPDGVVGKATWYALVRIYTAVTQLSELRSQGQQFYSINWEYPDALQEGSRGEKVRLLQYMLEVLSDFINQIPMVSVDGVYGAETADAVRAAQRWFGLPITGVVDASTWDALYDQYSGIENATFRSRETFPAPNTSANNNAIRSRYATTSTMTQFPGQNLQTGSRDPVKQEVVR